MHVIYTVAGVVSPESITSLGVIADAKCSAYTQYKVVNWYYSGKLWT